MLTEIRKAAFEREVETALMPQCVNLTSQEGQTLKSIMDRVEAAKQAAEQAAKKSNNPFDQFAPQDAGLTAEEQSLRYKLWTKAFSFRDCRNDALGHIMDEAHKRETDDFHRMDSYDKGKRPDSKQ